MWLSMMSAVELRAWIMSLPLSIRRVTERYPDGVRIQRLMVVVSLACLAAMSPARAAGLAALLVDEASRRLRFSPDGVVTWRQTVNRRFQEPMFANAGILVVTISQKRKHWELRIPSKTGKPPIWVDIDRNGVDDLLIPSVDVSRRYVADAVVMMSKTGKSPRILEGSLLPYNQADSLVVKINGKPREAALLINRKSGAHNTILEYEDHPGDWYVARCSKIIGNKLVPLESLRINPADANEEATERKPCKNWKKIPFSRPLV